MTKFKNVLLIDDDEDYLFLTKYSLEKLHLFEKVNTLFSGYEALSFLLIIVLNINQAIAPL